MCTGMCTDMCTDMCVDIRDVGSYAFVLYYRIMRTEAADAELRQVHESFI